MNEREIIERKFRRLIDRGRILKPKPNKKDFFKHKAEKSLQLAKDLLEKEEYLDWAISVSYYSMFYNTISLLAHINVDLQEIDESVHTLTYQALVYHFHIRSNKIEERYFKDFKLSMEESNIRLKNLAKRKSEEILSRQYNAIHICGLHQRLQEWGMRA